MISDLFDTRFGYESISIYLNDTEIPVEFVQDWVTKIEIDSELRTNGLQCLVCADDRLFKNTIGKTLHEFGPDDTIRIIIEDKDHTIFDRRFTYFKAQECGKDEKAGNFYIIIYRDSFSYVFGDLEFVKYITAHGYSGTPLEIIQQVLTDAFTPVVEVNKTRKEKNIKLDIKKFKTKIPDDKPIYDHFVMDKNIWQNLMNYLRMYNIYIFQDFLNTMHIWQNISVDQLEVLNDADGTELYSEEASQLYACKICDRIKMPGNTDTLGRVDFKAYKNIDGIHHEYQYLKFDDFLPMIAMNNNSDKYRNLKQSLDSASSSKMDTLEHLVRKSFFKYLNNNVLIIFVRPFFKKINVGTKVSVRIHANTEFTGDQMEGDLEYNGIWLITQSTICVLGQHLVCRLVLKRFDNMQRTDSSMNKIEPKSNDGAAFSINKPKNMKTGTLDDASRDNLDDELKKDVETRVAKVGSNSSKGWDKVATKTGNAKSDIYRVKEKKDGLLSGLKKAKETFLEGKREALLQVKRLKNGIEQVARTVNDVKESINSVRRGVNEVVQTANNVKNEVKRFKQFTSIENLKNMAKNEARALKNIAINETVSEINKTLGTNITAEEYKYMIKNKSITPILERQLNDYSGEFTHLSDTTRPVTSIKLADSDKPLKEGENT